VLLNRTVLAAGRTEEVFTQANLERAFGGVLRHFTFEGPGAAGKRATGVLSDDERPFVVYSENGGRTAPEEPVEAEAGR
jgi:manganese/iron transport system ATP-binding protein